MLEYVDIDDSQDDSFGLIYEAGINFRPNEYLVFKLEFAYVDFFRERDMDFSVLSAQAAVFFGKK